MLLEKGYGAPRVGEAMGRPVPVPVPLCALTEAERATMLASVVKMVNGAIAMGTDSSEGGFGILGMGIIS